MRKMYHRIPQEVSQAKLMQIRMRVLNFVSHRLWEANQRLASRSTNTYPYSKYYALLLLRQMFWQFWFFVTTSKN